MRRPLIYFLTLLLLWAVMAELNHRLSGWHVTLFAGGLFVTYAAFVLPLGEALGLAFAAGLVADSQAPVRFGSHAVLFAAVATGLYRWRHRLPHDEVFGRVAIALVANLALFFAVTFLRFRPPPAALWPRLGSDLIFSQLWLALIAPWFFALQEKALEGSRHHV